MYHPKAVSNRVRNILVVLVLVALAATTAILVFVLALGLTAFEVTPNHRLVVAAAQITPSSKSLPNQLSAPIEQKVYMGDGTWLVTNAENGHFIRVESTNPSSTDPLADPSKLSQTPAEQKVSIGGRYILVTDPENGHFIRVEVALR